MFKKLFYGILVLIALAFVFKNKFTNDKHDTPETRSLAGDTQASFHSVEVHGNFLIKLDQGDKSTYQIEADKAALEDIEVFVDDQTLVVKNKKRSWMDFEKNQQVLIHITAPEYREIEAHGAVQLESLQTLKSQSLDLSLTGASEGDLSTEVNELALQTSGAADFKVAGQANRAQMEVSGAGEIKAYDLEIDDLQVSISGAGHAEVYVNEKLDVRVSGAGSVKYKGSPDEISQHISGAGSVKKVP